MKLAFYKATRPGIAGIYNRLVRWIEKSPYSHVEVVFSDGLAASASFMDKGVRFKQIDFDDGKWDFKTINTNVIDEAYSRQWFIDHEGAGYDIGGNIKFVLPWWPQSKNKWFCTEAIGESFRLDSTYNLGPRKLEEVDWIYAPTT